MPRRAADVPALPDGAPSKVASRASEALDTSFRPRPQWGRSCTALLTTMRIGACSADAADIGALRRLAIMP